MLKPEFDAKIKNCPVCQSGDIARHLTDFKSIKIDRCQGCGFQFMNPPYSDSYLSDYYAAYMEEEDFELWQDALFYGHSFYFSLIEKYISPGRLLDIGCGNGHLIRAALERGWESEGFDVDPKTTARVSERHGVKTYQGDFLQLDLRDNDYDLITMHQVLEHLKRPNEYLHKINSLLKPGGGLFIALPNIRSLSNRFKHVLERAGLKKKSVGKYYETSHHLLYFDPTTLPILLARHGFEVLYKRNGHKVRPGQSGFKRFLMRNVSERLLAKSTFLMISRKR